MRLLVVMNFPPIVENTEDLGRPDQSLIFQTGSRRPVLISERSSSVVKDGGAENIGKIGVM